MNTKYNNEELLHSLPDYISNKLSDPVLRKVIETRISTDADFQSEYFSLSETLDMFNPEFSETPSEAYFNNLSVRINEKLSREAQPVSFFEKLGIKLKFALPALAVILIIVTVSVYMNSAVDNGIENITAEKIGSESNNGSEKNTPDEKISEENIAKDENPSKENQDITDSKMILGKPENGSVSKNHPNDKTTEVSNGISNNENSVIPRDMDSGSGTVKAFAFDDLAFSDNSDSGNDKADNSEQNDNSELSESEQEDFMLLSGDTDDEFLEEDIFELTPEEQLEIVDYLKQS
ncbi:MAG: hypothetical protein KBF96_03330 [Ignavibacteria bacterium]|nr:hypothetical protein [Ignavibacteria bacterium]